MRKVERKKTKIPSLLLWAKVRNPFRVILNFIVIHLSRFLPSLSAKRFLLRLIGMKIGKNVCIGLSAMFDIFFPELIEIDNGAIIGYNVTILTHEFLDSEWRKGKVKIGKGAIIGANSTILPGVEIDDGCVVSAMSLVNRNLGKGLYGGVPARRIRH